MRPTIRDTGPPATTSGPGAVPFRPAEARPPTTLPEANRVHRDPDGAWIAGVAKGISEHLGWHLGAVRFGFGMLAMANLFGVLVYGVLWVLMPLRPPATEAPGLEAARRTNMRTTTVARKGDAGVVSALAIMGVGVIWMTRSMGLGIPLNWFWPLAFAMAGLGLIWRQADAEPRPKDTSKWVAPLVSTHGWVGITRMVVGVGMVTTAASAVVASSVGVAQVPALLMLSLLIMGGVGLMAAPWIHRWRREMQTAREEKILSDARADMAAHLHDSVLQTLALIQRQSSDPRAVASLARRQERELRGWLYGDEGPAESHLAAALRAGAQAIEDERGVPVEVVCVGDAELSSDLAALVSAAREAMMNAAKHSGADRIDVFAEVEDGHVEVFVRDRGRGFAMGTIADDRQGVRGSIIGRMERHGGRATIRSTPGEGTDIKLEMDL